jgi:hypothetical protein
MSKAIRIDTDGDNIRIRTLIESRLTQHGFGMFLEDIKPGEISITAKAFKILNDSPYRGGLMGLEIFAINVLAWGKPSYGITVPQKFISHHRSSEAPWFPDCCVIEEALS